jgi:hypothetical protein
MTNKRQDFKVQTYIFPKDKYTLDKAKAWLKERGSNTGVDETEESYRFRQANPDEFTRMRTVDNSNENFKWLPDGVKAVVGPTKKQAGLGKSMSMMNRNNFPYAQDLAEEYGWLFTTGQFLNN